MSAASPIIYPGRVMTGPGYGRLGRSYSSNPGALAHDADLVGQGLRGKGQANDAFVNAAARMGFGTNSVAEGADYALVRWSYDYQLMYTLYRNQWIARNAVDIPAQDMVRAWPTVKSDLEPEDLTKLDRAIRETETKEKMLETLTWARLFGGAGALIVIDGQENRLDEPLDIDTVELGSYKGLIPFDRWVGIYPDTNICTDITRPKEFNLPEYYRVQSLGGSGSFRVHASRILRFTGPSVPAPEYQAQMYWGISVLEIGYEAMKMRDNMLWNILGMSFRSNILAYNEESLAQMLSGASMNQNALVAFYQRLEVMNSLLSNQNMVVLGKEGKLQSTQYAFSGCAEILEQYRLECTGAFHIPELRLFGYQPGGLGVKDDPSERLYEEFIAMEQDVKMRPQLERLYPVIAQSTLGFVPDDLDLDFPSIRVPGEDEKAALSKNITDGVLAAFQANLITKAIALKELKQSSASTQLWTNITDEDIAAAEQDDKDNKELLKHQQEMLLEAPAPGEEGEESGAKKPAATGPQKQIAADSGHRDLTFAGIPVTIEHEAGERRQIRNERGELVYDRRLKAPYGYLRNTLSVDGDELDLIIGPAENAPFVYWIQMRDLGPDVEARQDEPKIMLGWQSESSAIRAFEDMYAPGWLDSIEEIPLAEFIERLEEANGQILEEVGAFALDDFVESEHPREKSGENAGQFTSGGGGGSSSGSASKSESSGGAKQKPVDVSKFVAAPTDRTKWPAHTKGIAIPPVWKDIRINPDPNGHLVATGINTVGTKVPVYSKAFLQQQSEAKFKRAQEVDRKFGEILAQNEKRMKSRDPEERQHAQAEQIVMSMGIRPGSDVKRGKVMAYGASTLKGEHVVLDSGNGQVYLRFTGKKGVSLNLPVEDPNLAKDLLALKKSAEKNEDNRLFPAVSGNSLLKYTHTLDGGKLKTKDFRTALGTRKAAEAIKNIDPPKDAKDYKAKVKQVATAVSDKLGNTPAVALSAYINPVVFAEWKESAGL